MVSTVLVNLEVRVREFGRSVAAKDQGASMVEYALLVGLIAVVLIAAITLLSGGIAGLFERANSSLTQIPGSSLP